VTGGGTATNVEASFKKEDGVTCEACHGAASGFKMIHNKPENLEKAKAAGLVLGDKTDAKFCEKCHNAESPTFKGFKMEEMWAKIAHGLPAKK
jgi:cytochrome c5